MPRLVLLILVFLLSGVPATAVVCDLLLCVEPAAASACHEHASGDADAALAAVAAGCSHFAAIPPAVQHGARAHLTSAASTAGGPSAILLSAAPERRGPVPSGAPPPLQPPTSRPLTLRI